MSYHAEFKKQLMELQNHLKFSSHSQWNWYSQHGNDQFEIHILADAALAAHISNFLYQNPNTGFFDLDSQIIKDNTFRTSPNFFACFIYDKTWDDVSVFSRIPNIIGDGHYGATVVTAVLEKALNTVSKHKSYLAPLIYPAFNQPPPTPVFIPPPPMPPPQKVMAQPPMFGGMQGAVPCDGRTVSIPVEFKVKMTSHCDCGAHKCGYSDTDDFAHSSWCKTHERMRIPF